ncbi:MAG: hypothetical protein M3O87_05685 [Candidatus Dormibacteraeota bacterium]|nr:hypothetical protein [Candidatus Dormibacteraeota bacterium]
MGIELTEFAVEVFTENMVLHGRVRSGRRLSDLINEPEPYIGLDDVEIFPYASDVMLGLSKHHHGMINKASIVFMTEVAKVAGVAGFGDSDARLAKEAVRILVYANQFAINADIHLLPGVELGNMLTQGTTRFLPVTNATVTPTQTNSQVTSFRRDFMLVNPQQIRYLGGVEPAPADVAAEGEPGEELIG